MRWSKSSLHLETPQLQLLGLSPIKSEDSLPPKTPKSSSISSNDMRSIGYSSFKADKIHNDMSKNIPTRKSRIGEKNNILLASIEI